MFKRARLPIRKLFTDTCTIISNERLVVDDFGSMETNEVIICENEPCRLSFSTFKNGDTVNDGPAEITQLIKLFIREDLVIPVNSRVIITRNDTTTEYKCSGKAALHSNHQEINLKLGDDYG
jgi:hypothetical protein